MINKAVRQLHLLFEDPEAFARNVAARLHPERYVQRIIDLIAQPPLCVHSSLSKGPRLNILLPSLRAGAMTGGPNTAITLGALLAREGIPVRIVHSDTTTHDDTWLSSHIEKLTGHCRSQHLTATCGTDSSRSLGIGPQEVWLATHWPTAQQVKPLLGNLGRSWFAYLIQDYEPGFYAWSSNCALALETYQLPHKAVINERQLSAYLSENVPGSGQLDSVAFDPAVDRTVFSCPTNGGSKTKKTLLVYARPSNPRNMLGISILALRRAIAEGALLVDDWDFLAIGSGSTPKIELSRGAVLRPLAMVDYIEYGKLLASADILLCLMLSPHTSYPVLEMAATGGQVVTNTFATKTAEILNMTSPDIISASPTIEGVTEALRLAAMRCHEGRTRSDRLALPTCWDESLRPVLSKMKEWLEA